MSDKKVLVIGLDGATWDLIKPWATEGKLPTFQKLLNESTYGVLQSTVPPSTVPAIPSFMTGKNPGKHGVVAFVRPKVDRDLGLFDSTKITGEFYRLPATEGLKKVIIGLPLTYPAREINGCIVSGPLTPNKASAGFIYPPSMREEIAPLLDQYRIDMDVGYLPGKQKKYLENLVKVAEMRTRMAEYLLEHKEWDIAIVYFIVLDRVQHFFMGLDDNYWVLQAYSKIDNCLQRLMACVDQDTHIIVFSDHGFGPIKGKFCVNAWLEENNFLFHRGKRRMNIGPQRLRLLVEKRWTRFLKNLIPNRFLKHALLSWQNRDWARGFAGIDWANTKAFATISGIHINNKLSPGERLRTRQEIIRKLKDLKNPETGRKLDVKITTREAEFSGPYLDKLPDIFYSIEDYQYEPSATFEDVNYLLPHSVPRGWHRKEAIFLAYGNDIEKGREIVNCSIYDIAPTILHFMGFPVPQDMDGTVLKNIFRENSNAARRDIVYQTAVDDTERVRGKLRRLKSNGKI